jgi:hypothetical protein
MKRKILIGVLALGTLAGYGMGFKSMRCRAEHRRDAFERHVASVCVDAARDADRDERHERRGRHDRDEPQRGDDFER